MEIRKVKTELILETAHSALNKLNRSDYAAVENVCSCIDKLKFRCKDYGYRAIIDKEEFYDFIKDIISEAKNHDLVIIVTVSRNTGVDKLKELRTLRDNAVDSITNLNESLNGGVMIEAAAIKPNLAREYSIDYATFLL